MTPIRFAVFGARHWHVLEIARAIRADERFELVGVAEPDEETRYQVQTELQIPAFTSHREMLDADAVDAVAVASINNERVEVIADALAADVHVLADKPMVVSLDQLDQVEAAARSSQATLSCALTLRFTPHFVAAKAAIDRGEIGQVIGSYAQGPHKLGVARRPAWMFNREKYGGVLLDLAVHDIDVARWIHGAEPVAVVADEGSSRFADLDFADYASVYLRMADGSVAVCRSSWLTPDDDPSHGDRRLIVEGTEGSLEIVDAAERRLTINSAGTVETRTNVREEMVGQPDAMAELVGDFAHGISGEAPQLITARETIESHRWTLKARVQAESA
jgi:predicted dehydrogenase